MDRLLADFFEKKVDTRARNVINNCKVRTYSDLRKWKMSDLMRIENCGKRTAFQIYEAIRLFDKELGLKPYDESNYILSLEEQIKQTHEKLVYIEKKLQDIDLIMAHFRAKFLW